MIRTCWESGSPGFHTGSCRTPSCSPFSSAFVTFILGLVWTRSSPTDLLQAWYDGFWTPPLMVFALQMALILITGHALASTRPGAKGSGRARPVSCTARGRRWW